ncbi:TRAP transporter substrate-binding protein [Ancylobacter defluvii]|uniref:2,3-diketo-L-gulonate-binding periplasmic protein YiaO n=1 Tax=Ancylobacter defluvii TaxID=1282440 RepID=A0A9W6JTR4_9HYPH|nr:TRAP transporter substrate-binding protein [Ancylobacter defluvii]MBS7587621.1 TRAP transporter substrate-binding protein [Ancylobacter defluvii]GLK82431.1 2,3-diketo-L-gulonate-binding periplasmic protein YiaO [Ancylobacter defluvii]
MLTLSSLKRLATLKRLAAIGVVASVLGAAGLASPALSQTKLRLAVETNSGDPLNIMLANFRDALAKSAGSEVAIEFFEGGALGDETALMELIRAGEVQVVPLGSDVVTLDKGFSVLDTPFLFADKASARAAFDGRFGELLAASLREKAGLQVLAFGELGFRTISTTAKQINVPADLKGLKIRTPGSPTRILAFKTLGAAPTPMPLGEVYMALKQGALDGQENPLSVIKDFSFFEVQKFIALTNHVYTPITLAMNGAAYDALSAEMKAKLKDAAKAGSAATRKVSDDSDARLVDEFKSKGVTVTTPDLAAFRTAAEPVKGEIAKVVGPDLMTKLEASLK